VCRCTPSHLKESPYGPGCAGAPPSHLATELIMSQSQWCKLKKSQGCKIEINKIFGLNIGGVCRCTPSHLSGPPLPIIYLLKSQGSSWKFVVQGANVPPPHAQGNQILIYTPHVQGVIILKYAWRW
jgi:hypothetical protein